MKGLVGPTTARQNQQSGEWDVTTPDGKPAGRNSITRELNGCVLHERWAGAGGMNGEGFNMWDRVKKR